MTDDFIECVPNFSDGRHAGTIAALVDAVSGTSGVLLLGHTADVDHNRSVLTFAGPPSAVVDAAVRAVRVAVERIDLTRHTGVHPRLGAADVVPFVPLGNVPLERCARIAVEAAERIWKELRVPAYLYEAAARTPERSRLENVRRGGFEVVRTGVHAQAGRAPDIGGPALHPTAGAAIVGARRFLIAWNVNLATSDVAIAKQIARAVRESSGGLPHVKALGLLLGSRSLAQVSMNLTDFERTPIPVVYEAVRHHAERAGVGIAEVELIGFMPRAAYEQVAAARIPIANLTPERVIENRIETLLAEIGGHG